MLSVAALHARGLARPEDIDARGPRFRTLREGHDEPPEPAFHGHVGYNGATPVTALYERCLYRRRPLARGAAVSRPDVLSGSLGVAERCSRRRWSGGRGVGGSRGRRGRARLHCFERLTRGSAGRPQDADEFLPLLSDLDDLGYVLADPVQ